eukprot:5320485-Ditylum_brightwellii.AAC.1
MVTVVETKDFNFVTHCKIIIHKSDDESTVTAGGMSALLARGEGDSSSDEDDSNVGSVDCTIDNKGSIFLFEGLPVLDDEEGEAYGDDRSEDNSSINMLPELRHTCNESSTNSKEDKSTWSFEEDNNDG